MFLSRKTCGFSALAWVSIAFACGPGRCGRGQTDDSNDYAFVRCLKEEPSGPASGQSGLFRWTRDEAVLRMRRTDGSAAGSAIRVAAFSGPGFLRGARTLPQSLTSAAWDIALVLGSVGDQQADALAFLKSLAQMNRPAIVVAGGRDEWDVYQAAFEALSERERNHVVDATTLERIEIDGQLFVPLAGAPGARYARNDDACGFEPSDREERFSSAKKGQVRAKWLLGWAQSERREASPFSAEFFAWGAKRTPLAVPALFGPARIFSDGGGLAPGALFMELRADGTVHSLDESGPIR